MRIIGGKLRGRPVDAPKGMETRPTSDRVREALFNIWADRVPGARFLDLFAGSGANGLEALSRGAAHAAFVDAARPAIRAIRANLAQCGVDARASVYASALPAGLRALARREAPFDLVLADPPYRFAEYAALLDALAVEHLLAPGAAVVMEHARQTSVPPEAGPFKLARQAHYGGTTLSFYA